MCQTMGIHGGLLLLLCSGFVLPPLAFSAEKLPEEIGIIQQVESQGAGHTAAVAAVQKLQQQGPEMLLPILEGLEQANPLAANWLRNSFESIAARAVEQNQPLPQEELFQFLKQKERRPLSRRLVFEWLQKVAPEQANALIPGFLNDPSDELRREAVTLLLQQAEALNNSSAEGAKAEQKELYQRALTGASDDDQVRKIVAGLKRFDITVDLQKHYGFITRWTVIGPFDNKDEMGFAVAYPPEKEIQLQAEYPGQLGPVTWQELSTDDAYGVFDLAKLVGPYKGAVEYAYHEFRSEQVQPVEFRLATPNAWKLWLNGKLLFEREEYHRGNFFDQYRIQGELQPGKNQILLKVCQNEMEQSWAQDWKIQFRVCNPYGMAVTPAE